MIIHKFVFGNNSIDLLMNLLVCLKDRVPLYAKETDIRLECSSGHACHKYSFRDSMIAIQYTMKTFVNTFCFTFIENNDYDTFSACRNRGAF